MSHTKLLLMKLDGGFFRFSHAGNLCWIIRNANMNIKLIICVSKYFLSSRPDYQVTLDFRLNVKDTGNKRAGGKWLNKFLHLWDPLFYFLFIWSSVMNSCWPLLHLTFSLGIWWIWYRKMYFSFFLHYRHTMILVLFSLKSILMLM